MILIKNQQKKIKFSLEQLKKDAHHILRILRYDDFDVALVITTNATIRKYNKIYRKKDKPTDILSFSFYPDLKAGERIKPATDEDKNLGDLILSAEYIQKAAQELHQTMDERLRILLVHGICHLLGYDHEKDEDYKKMHRKEVELLRKLSK